MQTSRWKERLASLGIAGRCLLLAVALGIAVALVLPLAISLAGTAGAWAALSAALLIWIASAVSLAMGELFPGPGANAALMKMLFGMSIRMALPLAVCMLAQLQFSNSPLMSAGFVFYVLGFYLVALPIDTFLSVTGIAPKPTA